MEEDGVASCAVGYRDRTVIGSQNVLSAHGRLASAPQFHVEMHALSALVHPVHAFAQTEEMLVRTEHSLIIYAVGDACGRLLIAHAAGRVAHRDAPRVVFNLDDERSGGDGAVVYLKAYLRKSIPLHHPGLVGRQR